MAAKIQQDLQAGLIFAPEAASIPHAAKGQAVQASLAEVVA
ncbi:MAG: hypothetical protein ACE5FI_04840 [Anaerolineales bacterium]